MKAVIVTDKQQVYREYLYQNRLDTKDYPHASCMERLQGLRGDTKIILLNGWYKIPRIDMDYLKVCFEDIEIVR